MENEYYTLILSKPDGYTTSMQCIMDRWNSEFSIDVEISEKDAINKISEAFATKSHGGSFTAHLIGIVEETRDKYNRDMVTPMEKAIYEFEQYSGTSWRQEPGSYSVISYHHEDNHERIEEDAKRINELIRVRVEEIKKTTNKK